MDDSYGVQNTKMLFPLIYILPSYLLYFIIIYTIFISKSRKSKFVAPIYKLFGISSIIYVICSMTYFLAIRIPNTPFFIPFVKEWGSKGIFVTALQMLLWYATNVAPLFHLVISFNRFTVFILKAKYELFWQKWLSYIVGICILLPIALIWHIPFQGIYIKLQNETDPSNSLRYLAAANRNAIPWMNNNPQNAAILITITSILSFAFNLFCVIKLLMEKFYWKNPNFKKTFKPEILLIVFTMLVLACDILHCLHQYTILTLTDQATYSVTEQATIETMFEIQYYIFDMTDLAPAWFILITNKLLRKAILPSKFFNNAIVPIKSKQSSKRMVAIT